MTDKQIKQNADAYASKLVERDYHEDIWLDLYDAHIAGALSRDEEIGHYRRIAMAYKIDAQDTAAECERLHDIIDQLRNPWISVKDRLPEESKKYKGWLSDTVFVVTNKDDGTSARYDHATKTWCPAKILQGSITHWMPIPELKK